MGVAHFQRNTLEKQNVYKCQVRMLCEILGLKGCPNENKHVLSSFVV